MKKQAITILLTVSALAMTFARPAEAESPIDIMVIVNKTLPQSSITREEVKKIFLKQVTTWKSGGHIAPVNAQVGSPLRSEFRRRALRMKKVEEDKFWEDIKTKTGAIMPQVFRKPQKAVFSVTMSISYCFRKDFRSDVAKVLLVLEP